MKTAVELYVSSIEEYEKKFELGLISFEVLKTTKKYWLEKAKEKEKEQIMAAVRYGQNNHTASVYDEGELYYNEIYNSDDPFIKSSIPNGNIQITKTNNL